MRGEGNESNPKTPTGKQLLKNFKNYFKMANTNKWQVKSHELGNDVAIYINDDAQGKVYRYGEHFFASIDMQGPMPQRRWISKNVDGYFEYRPVYINCDEDEYYTLYQEAEFGVPLRTPEKQRRKLRKRIWLEFKAYAIEV